MLLEVRDNSKRNLIDQIKIDLAIHAIESFNTREEASRFIGISKRTLRLWVNRYKELHDYKKNWDGRGDKWAEESY